MNKDIAVFPTDEYFNESRLGQHPGMTLRDYFAAKVMQGLAVFLVQNIPGWSRPANEQEIAEQAYAAADAMLAARESRQS